MNEEKETRQMMPDELNIDPFLNGFRGESAKMADAIDAASDQDHVTWLVSGGKRVAALVPVDVAEQDVRYRAG